MITENHVFGGGNEQSVLNPIVLVAIIVAALLIFSLPRRYVLAPFITILLLTPVGQQLVLFNVHWFAYRMITICALLRVINMPKPLFSTGINAIDRTFFAYYLCTAVAFVLLYCQVAAVINQVGMLLDTLGAYMVFRRLLSDETDVYRLLKVLGLLIALLATCMILEQVTLQNVFGLLGGTDAVPQIRNGHVRSQGAFLHSITAGCFAATLVPLFVLLWTRGRARVWATIGLLGCTVMTICSHSSTPIAAYASGVLAISLWPIRNHMRIVRWALVAVLLLLHLAMKAPVWFLIARVDLAGGSSSYHRAALVDAFLRHFWDWCLIGVKQTDVDKWAPELWDEQNQFVLAGQTGGLLGFVLFIAVIVHAFRELGIARLLLRGSHVEWVLWLGGASVLSNVVSFFGINYFDQSKVTWLVLLAVISASTVATRTSPLLNTTSGMLSEGFLRSQPDSQH